MSQQWDSQLYDTQHNFVTKYGNDVLQLLQAQSDELILDLGCGTGALTHTITTSGAKVIGIDSSPQMIAEAQLQYPATEFIVANGHDFSFNQQFDAVFSNAALHWMLKPEQVISRVWESLKPGGRFVFEMGGHSNVSRVLASIVTAAGLIGLPYADVINYYPSLGIYSTLLEQAGFRVEYAQTINRPTKLDGKDGLRNWVKMFRTSVLAQIPETKHEEFFTLLEQTAQPELYKDGIWWADYVRLRAVAKKPL